MRRLLDLLILASLATCLFAAGGVFPLSHPVYSEMEALYVLCGNAGLSPSRPWSGKEVSRMLSNAAADLHANAAYSTQTLNDLVVYTSFAARTVEVHHMDP